MARLAVIRSLQDRGFSRAAIHDLLVGWESGFSIADVIGVEQALTTDWDVDEGFVTDAELDAVFGDDPAPRKRAVELSLLRPADGGGYVISSQRVFDSGVQLDGARGADRPHPRRGRAAARPRPADRRRLPAPLRGPRA